MKPHHVMFKVQTLGLTPEHAIASIGAVLFDPRIPNAKADVRYVTLDWRNQGRFVDQDALAVWREKPKEVQKVLDGTRPLHETLASIAVWLPRDVKVWGNGPTFDLAFIANAYAMLDLPIPWRYWNERDCRTVLDMYNSSRGILHSPTRAIDEPAVETAIRQASDVCRMWSVLTKHSSDLERMRRKIQALNDPRRTPINQRRVRSARSIDRDIKG